MPIVGLTDRRMPEFRNIGTLRKGGEHIERTNKDGKKYNSYGKDLTGFRFTSDDQDALTVFNDTYGDEPRRVDIYLPYETVEENFWTCKEAWTASALQHRCDGVTCSRWLDKKTGKYSSESIPCLGKCKEVGRLKVILPALRRMVYVVAETHSLHDLVNLQGQLEALYMLRGSLRGIPMILSRSPREISTPRDDGATRARVTKWLMNVEAAPSWVELQLTAMERAALPIPSALPALPAPAPQITVLDSNQVVDMETGEIEDVAPAPDEPRSYARFDRVIAENKKGADRSKAQTAVAAFIAVADHIGVEFEDGHPDMRTMSLEDLTAAGKAIRAACIQQIIALANEAELTMPTGDLERMKPSELQAVAQHYIDAINSAEIRIDEDPSIHGATYTPEAVAA